MKQLVALIILVGTLLILVLVLPATLAAVQPDPIAQMRARQLAEDLYAADVAAGWLWRVVPPLLFALATVAGVAVLWNRWGATHQLERRATVDQVAALHQTPQSLTYAPHLRYQAPLAALPEPDAPQMQISVPTFAELLNHGAIGPRQPITLAIEADTGKPIIGDWRDLYSAGIGGMQGSGKTWTAVYLATQAALSGARLVVCDPHAGDTESLSHRLAPLAGRYLCAVASDPDAITAALQLAYDELERRRAGKGDRWPLLVVCDEWTSLMLRNDQAGEKFIHFATEGRKYGVHGLLLAHGWTAAAAGGSEVRNRLTSHYVHRTRPAEARYQLGIPAELAPRDVLQLPPGVGYLLSTRGDLKRIIIPPMTPADVAHAAALIEHTPAPGDAGRPFGFHPSALLKPAENPHETTARNPENPHGTPQPSPEDARLLARFCSGESIGALAREISPTGPAYTRARDTVEAVIRRRLVALETRGEK